MANGDAVAHETSGRSTRRRRTRQEQTPELQEESYRETDVAADQDVEQWGDQWPEEAPVFRSKADVLRAEMVSHPGRVVTLAWRLHDSARAARIAKAFRQASDHRLPMVAPQAVGHYEARHYWDPNVRVYRIVARYIPDAPETGSDEYSSPGPQDGGY